MTLKKAEWENTKLVTDKAVEEISKLKKLSDKDVAVFGSANLMSGLMRGDLIDEHRVMINPVILGSGTPLFQTKDKLTLKLLKTKTFNNGNILLYYESKK